MASKQNNGKIADDVHSELEGPVSSFQSYAAEGDILAKQGDLRKAIEAYTKALEKRPGDKNCLVFRSKCYLQLGDSQSALEDAQESLKEDKEFFKGIFQKAEALYAIGDFEMALVFYHRGNRLRPEFNDFRLGIQKASEAIDNSVGNPDIHKFQAPPNFKKETLIQSEVKDLAAATLNLNNSSKNVDGQAFINTLQPIKGEPISKDPSVRQLLGELYADKVFLEEIANDKDFVSNPNPEISNLVNSALIYLEKRTEFWRQQKPIYARKKEQSNVFVKAVSAKNRRTLHETQKNLKLVEDLKIGSNERLVHQLKIENEEQKNIEATLKLVRNAFKRKDFVCALETTESVIERLGDVLDVDQRKYLLSECYGYLGNIHSEMGNLAQSVLYHKKDLSVSNEIGNFDGLKRSYGNLGIAYVKLKRFREACTMFQARLKVSKKTTCISETAPAKRIIREKFKKLNNNSISVNNIKIDNLEKCWLLHDIARCKLEIGEIEDALNFALESLTYSETSKDKEWILKCKVLVSQIKCYKGNLNESHLLHLQALQLSVELGDKKTQSLIESSLLEIEKREEFSLIKRPKAMTARANNEVETNRRVSILERKKKYHDKEKFLILPNNSFSFKRNNIKVISTVIKSNNSRNNEEKFKLISIKT
ncbi:Tetratricopeptide repeat protein 25 [Clydaea vesicula]|uniref:Outer dynein arm-docking complex subunit 4 n=1 Tax=Clydaea vesicula TaxID=447962 RepID=A0AAD5XY81_9FUNG|nr:Tetratricopeptide repeat protein 25 [Clydaea vesicula]KAJ3391393.1 Tetratricopeptide repeat protein 25 [Lobulomyces angularis]